MNHGGANAVGSPSDEAAPSESPAISHDDASETPSDEASSPESASAVPISPVPISVPPSPLEGSASIPQPQREISIAGRSAGGKPTLSERIEFQKKCCEADEDDLNVDDREIRAMEEALQAKRQARRQVEERLVASRRVLKMLMRQLEGTLPGIEKTADC